MLIESGDVQGEKVVMLDKGQWWGVFGGGGTYLNTYYYGWHVLSLYQIQGYACL
jgi:hypothetical protein